MELALCLGDNTNKFSFMEKPSKTNNNPSASSTSTSDKDLGFNMGLDVLGFGGHRSLSSSSSPSAEDEKKKNKRKPTPKANDSDGFRVSSSVDPSLQLQLHFPWLPENSRRGGRMLSGAATVPEEEEEAALSMSVSPPDSVTSSFRLDFGIKSYGYERRNNKRDIENDEVERSTSRASNEDNDDDNGATRKKLRLSKDQSAFLEDSFKEHSTLNPKQKIALAKQLNLRPRQVEVWFQNRRARTKLKQTEVDCEYLKRCCESLTEENRRLQKEVKELRALKTSSPFCMQLPATTLTMCPSCERVATSVSQPSTSAAHNIDLSKSSFHSPLIPVKPGTGKQVS
ncbi:Homeobox-leucine zipper protein HAT14 [Raphanus sativus]|uniref:Homeobox-leucine zipper protein HAT14 n=1 Tax=Raphanus sativus TaxID=3726 RepID=A0A6J0K2Z5_RAPSA|nr:homeobox-leucine zipper protein HAT14 [Raphanus sativus]KAJ4883338.1 Homeobox-leucine zipper protein HAT14 [Raphanus sativus]